MKIQNLKIIWKFRIWTFEIWKLEFENSEFENSEFENWQFGNLQFENVQFENLQFENLQFDNKIQNLNNWNLKIWNSKIRNSKIRNSKIQNLNIWNLKIRNWKLKSERAIFWAGVRFKNFFGTYLCRQSTLVFEVQPYLFAFNSATFVASFALFLALHGRGYVQKHFQNLPTYIDNQLWFSKYSPIFCFWFGHIWGLLLHFFWPLGVIFLALWGYFWGRG